MTFVRIVYIPDCIVNIINELVSIHVASSHVIGPMDFDVEIGMAEVAVTTGVCVTYSLKFMLVVGKNKRKQISNLQRWLLEMPKRMLLHHFNELFI